MTSGSYGPISIAGGDTAKPANLAVRIDAIRRYVPLMGSRVLDAGCGAGEYVQALAECGADVRGVEYLAHKVREWATRQGDDGRVSEGDLASLPFAEHTFDVVLLNEVLEHVPNESLVLIELRRVLKPGGVLLVFSPNRRYPFETHGIDRKQARVPPIRTLFFPWLPVAVLRRLGYTPWARNYWPGELQSLLAAHGFLVVAHDYVWQTFENISGRQPPLMRRVAPALRRLSSLGQRIPLVRSLGASQLIVARRS